MRRLGRRALVPRSALEALWKAQATGLGVKEAPALFRKTSVNLDQLLDDALAHLKRNKWSYKTDVPRFAKTERVVWKASAEVLTAREIGNKLAIAAEKESGLPPPSIIIARGCP